MTLCQEFSTYAVMLAEDEQRLKEAARAVKLSKACNDLRLLHQVCAPASTKSICLRCKRAHRHAGKVNPGTGSGESDCFASDP
jgi:aspartate ammonia-lyase